MEKFEIFDHMLQHKQVKPQGTPSFISSFKVYKSEDVTDLPPLKRISS
jgi:hypothetical protein